MLIHLMSDLGLGNLSDFDLKIASLGPLLVRFLVEIWSDISQILRFLGLIFCLAALVSCILYPVSCTLALIGITPFSFLSLVIQYPDGILQAFGPFDGRRHDRQVVGYPFAFPGSSPLN